MQGWDHAKMVRDGEFSQSRGDQGTYEPEGSPKTLAGVLGSGCPCHPPTPPRKLQLVLCSEPCAGRRLDPPLCCSP